MKYAAVPVLDNVAASLRAMIPDFPMPVTDHAARSGCEQVDCCVEPFIQSIGDGRNRLRLDADHASCQVDPGNGSGQVADGHRPFSALDAASGR